MADTYGELVRVARQTHTPPITAKRLAKELNVTAPFITDIEKGRRLPALDKQNRIKELLANEQFPESLFDDLAAADNEDTRIVAEDLAKMIRQKPEIRELLRMLDAKEPTASQMKRLIDMIGGAEHAVE